MTLSFRPLSTTAWDNWHGEERGSPRMTPPSLQELSDTVRGESLRGGARGRVRNSRIRASLALALSDAVVLVLVITGSIAVRAAFMAPAVDWTAWTNVIVGIVLGNALASVWRGLYPGYGICAIAELRSTFYAVTGVFSAVIALTFFTQGTLPYARSILVLSWLFGIPLVTIVRMTMRKVLARMSWWGTPVLIVGERNLATRVVETLRRNASIGLRPFVIVEEDEDAADYGYYHGVPVIGGVRSAEVLARSYEITHGILALPHTSGESLQDTVDRLGRWISHITLMSELLPPQVMWISNGSSEVLMSADIEHRLQQPTIRFKKRLFDLTLSIPMLILALPVMAMIALIIRLTSKGPVLFHQDRVGYGGRHFRIHKFRTMVDGAEKVLDALLESDEAAREEFQRFHKLKRDPRITAFGRWLRKTSLDELPQLWNVVKGNMTLVGPRPILPSEIDQYGYEIPEVDLVSYTSVRPGVTGLWQVTVRAEEEFSVRMQIDRYYVRNWSLFLDLYIVLRTVGVVVFGRGGY